MSSWTRSISQTHMRPSKEFLLIGEKDIYFRRSEEKGQNLRGTKAIFGNRKHKKTNFLFGGKRKKPIYFRGTRKQVPHPLPERALHIAKATLFHLSYVIFL